MPKNSEADFRFFSKTGICSFPKVGRPQAPRHRLKPLACPPHKQQETERSERKASGTSDRRTAKNQQRDHLDIPLLRHKQMRRIGQSDNASKQHPHPHPHPHPHTRTPALPTFAQSFRAFHLPMPALFPSTTIRSYRCPQPIFENKRIRRPVGNIRRIEQRRSIYTLSNM